MSAPKASVTGLPRGARFYRADLHVHSLGGSHDVKDTSMTAEQIVQRAVDEGLDVVAIADHNEITNVQAAVDAAAGRLLLVPAVELSTSQGHLLCYLPSYLHGHSGVRARVLVIQAARGGYGRRVEEEPLMCEGAPPRFDHGVRERQFREGQDPAQNSRGDQLVDLGIHVFDAGVRQHDRSRL